MSEIAQRNQVQAFAALGPTNPLRQLHDEDRQLLWAYLKLFSVLAAQPPSRDLNLEPEELASRTARDAAKLAVRLEADVFQGPLAAELHPFFSGFEVLPVLLREFSKRVSGAIDLVGGPGRKGELLTNQLLIIASEFVRLRMGSPYDEHVAELLQGIRETKDGEEESDFSGDAIRKRRKYMQKNYPVLYQTSVQRAKDSFGPGSTN